MADERQRVDVRLALAEEAIPSTEPDWDPYKGRKGRHLITCLLQGMTQVLRKVVNYNKIKEVTRKRMKIQLFFWADSQKPLKTLPRQI